MIKLCPDLRQRLAAVGYNTYTAKLTRSMSPSTLAQLLTWAENQEPIRITGEVLNTLCMILDCQPNDLIKYVPDQDELDQLSEKWPGLRSARAAEARAAIEARIEELKGQLEQLDGSDPYEDTHE